MNETDLITTAADRLALQQGCYLDLSHGDRVIKFIEERYAPQYVGGQFRLLPWQKLWLAKLYSWRLPCGRRRWRKALLSVAKKNGKSLLAGGVALYEALASGTPSPLVVTCSTTKENARQIYDEVKNSITRHPGLKKLAKLVPSQKIIRFRSVNGELRSISNDAGNAEGLNVSCCIGDELHQWGRTGELYRTLEYSTVARPDGVFVLISTAGNDQSHFYYDLVTKARNVLKGDDLDTSFFASIYEPDQDDDIDDPATWRKANPSLGVSFSEADFKRDLDQAKSDTASLLSWKRYRLNTWTQADDAFIEPARWDACRDPIDSDQLANAPCFVGLDLAQTTDLCSVSTVHVLPDRRFYVDSHSWVCEDGVRRREMTNLPRYQTFQADRELTITPGTCTDYRAIRAYILDLRKRFNVKEVICDPYNATDMVNELMAEGLVCYRMTQNHRQYTAPVKAFEVAIREGRLKHGGNRLLRWSTINCRLDQDGCGNVKPAKDTSADKIDPTVAALMAFGRAVEYATTKALPSVYATRGIRVI